MRLPGLNQPGHRENVARVGADRTVRRARARREDVRPVAHTTGHQGRHDVDRVGLGVGQSFDLAPRGGGEEGDAVGVSHPRPCAGRHPCRSGFAVLPRMGRDDDVVRRRDGGGVGAVHPEADRVGGEVHEFGHVVSP